MRWATGKTVKTNQMEEKHSRENTVTKDKHRCSNKNIPSEMFTLSEVLTLLFCCTKLYCSRLYWVLLDCTGPYLAVLGCSGLYWAVLGSSGLHWAVVR